MTNLIPAGLDRAAQDVPEIHALRLATLYGDNHTSLVSLTHRVVVAEWEGDCPQAGIPHLHVTTEIENNAGKAFHGDTFDAEQAGFPGYDALLTYLDRHPELLSGQ